MPTQNPSKEDLLKLHHNDHEKAFFEYLKNARHIKDKQTFLLQWIQPTENDMILECGSSSGRTSIHFSRTTGCYCLGIDFDQTAIDISTKLRDQYFPKLKIRCQFQCDDLETMDFDIPFNKVLMPDFTEHIPDELFSSILANIRTKLGDITLYIYTPLRTHIFERMKHNNFFLKNTSGHINVKTEEELKSFLNQNGWLINKVIWRPSAIPLFKYLEMILGHIPFIGRLFQRRIAIIAKPDIDTFCKNL